MDFVFFHEKKLEELSPAEIKELVREGTLTSARGKALLKDRKIAETIWQPIHDGIQQRRFP